MYALLVIFAFLSTCYGHGGCPLGWFQYREKCFFVKNENVNNAEYLKFCAHLSATPATIQSPEEGEFLKKITKPGNNYWIGAYRVGKGKKHFVWKDNSSYKYEHWASGEPNELNYDGRECVTVWADDNNFWYDNNCNVEVFQLCQKPVNLSDHLSAKLSFEYSKFDCPFGWFQYGEKCFYVNNEPTAYAEAVNYCSFFDAVPASIHSADEEAFIRKITKEGMTYWIGANRVGVGKHKFVWKDGTEFKYEHWNPGEPDALNYPDHHCVSFQVDKNFYWWDNHCNGARLRLCQKFISAADQSPHIVSPDDAKCGCPVGWYKHGEKCIYVNHEKATHNQTIEFCSIFNSTPISIRSPHQEHFLKKVTKYGNYYLLGGYRVAKGKKTFAWIDGTQYKYERWAPNEPDSLDNPDYHCFSALADDNFFWYDHSCTVPVSQLCQKTAAVTDKCGCPTGWFQYGNKCFFVNNDKATNAEYVEYCKELNSEPASIHSLEEEEFLKKITKPGNYYWIGASRVGKGNKTFEWRDGTEFKYEHWASGQPDGLNSPNDVCVAVWVDPKFLWYDENCNLPKFQLCQKIINATDKPTKIFQTNLTESNAADGRLLNVKGTIAAMNQKSISPHVDEKFSQIDQRLKSMEDAINDIYYVISSTAKSVEEIIRDTSNVVNTDEKTAKGKLNDKDERVVQILSSIVDGSLFNDSSAQNVFEGTEQWNRNILKQ